MVPIHESDLAEERWKKQEWENFELWEQIEKRLIRKKHLWIVFTVFLFLVLSSIPVVTTEFPKWKSLKAARILAHELTVLKKNAAVDHQAYRLNLFQDTSFVIEKSASCSSSNFEKVREGRLNLDDQLRILDKSQAEHLKIPGSIQSYCYDFQEAAPKRQTEAFVIIPVKDLTEDRLDRVSLTVINGDNSEIDFD